jgi:hypothetical protein
MLRVGEKLQCKREESPVLNLRPGTGAATNRRRYFFRELARPVTSSLNGGSLRACVCLGLGRGWRSAVIGPWRTPPRSEVS